MRVKPFLVKKTFAFSCPDNFLKSEERDKLTDALYAIGASKIKRVGSSNHQMIYISFYDDYRDDKYIENIIYNEINKFKLRNSNHGIQNSHIYT